MAVPSPRVGDVELRALTAALREDPPFPGPSGLRSGHRFPSHRRQRCLRSPERGGRWRRESAGARLGPELPRPCGAGEGLWAVVPALPIWIRCPRGRVSLCLPPLMQRQRWRRLWPLRSDFPDPSLLPTALDWDGWGSSWTCPMVTPSSGGLRAAPAGTQEEGLPSRAVGQPHTGSCAHTSLLCRHTAPCGLGFGRPAVSTEWDPQRAPTRSFLNLAGSLTNKRKEYSERRIIG